MNIVLDSNILVKLVTSESGSDEARVAVVASLREGCNLYTVDAALVEALNALWKHVKIHRDLEADEAISAARDLHMIWSRLSIVQTSEHDNEALDMAMALNMPVYDSLYVTAARMRKARLYTADRRLFEASSNIVESDLLA